MTADGHVSVYEQVVDVDSLTGRDLRAVFDIANAPSETDMHACVARTMFGTCAQLTSVVTTLRSAPDEPFVLRAHYNEGVWDPYHVGFTTPNDLLGDIDELLARTFKPLIRSVDPTTFTVEWWYREPYYCAVPIVSVDGTFVTGCLALGAKGPIEDVGDLIAYARLVCAAIASAWERIGRREEAVRIGQRIEREHVLQTVHDSAVQDIFAAEMHLRELLDGPGLAPGQRDVIEHALAHIRTANRSLRAVLAEDAPAVRDRGVAFLREMVDEEIAFHLGEHGAPVDSVVNEGGALPASLVEPCRMFLREALCNVRKHAGAAQVVVMGSVREDVLMLTVQDDGRGGDGPAERDGLDEAPHFGIANLRRVVGALNGTVELDLQPGEGCALRMRIPLGCA